MALTGTYPLADHKYDSRFRGMVAVATGEKRPPRKGEWYLSGAIVEAYQAPNDLPTMPFHIARLVPKRLPADIGVNDVTAIRLAFAFDVETMNLAEPGALIKAARRFRADIKKASRA